MKINQLLILVPAFSLILGNLAGQEFISVKDASFYKNDKPYQFVGINFWYGMYLGANLNPGDREKLVNDLNKLDSLGVDNLRIMVGTEGPENEPWRVKPALQESPGVYNEDLWEGLDFFLDEISKRDMTAVLCLSNFFQWSGGMAQYVSWVNKTPIPYPHHPNHSWYDFQLYSASFFSNRKAQRHFKKFVKKAISRTNTINGKKYKEDPSIMAWQLANEPRGFVEEDSYISWVRKTSSFIQRKDKNHLVSLGGEGRLTGEMGTAFDSVSTFDELDYLTIHLWIENWGWYDPKNPDSTFTKASKNAQRYIQNHAEVAKELKKPLVIEEFGVSRDTLCYHSYGGTQKRDEFFASIFQLILDHKEQGMPISGCNVWSWSGDNYPPYPGAYWTIDDPLTGDPPHEKQGWYGIYSTDSNTLSLIRKYALLISNYSLTKN